MAGFRIFGTPNRLRAGDGSASAPSISFASQPTMGFSRPSTDVLAISLAGAVVHQFATTYYWIKSDSAQLALGVAGDVTLFRDAPNILALRNNTSAQALRVFNTYGNGGADYERGEIVWSGNILGLYSRSGGAGAARAMEVGTIGAASLSLLSAGAVRLTIGSGGETTVRADTATPAGGSTSARLIFGTTSGFGIYYGSGVPTVSAAQGSLYLRSDGSSTSTRLYVNNSSGSGTTWTGVTTAA